MDDPWADSPSPASVVIPPRPPKADRRSIPIPQPTKAADPELTEQDKELEEEQVQAEPATESETSEEIVTTEPIEVENEDVQEDQRVEAAGVAEADGFDDFDDFDAPAGGPSFSTPGGEGEDGFGDFGDFEEGDFEEQANGPIIDNQQEAVAVVEEPVRKWVRPVEVGVFTRSGGDTVANDSLHSIYDLSQIVPSSLVNLRRL